MSLDSVSNIVIWGYGEIAVGMFVGCLATLRPLFRKVFRLGSLGNSKGASKGRGGLSASPFPSSGRRTYGQMSRPGDDFEMGGMGNTSSAFKGSATTSTENEVRTSITSDSDSLEQILKDARKVGMGGTGIMVSRQVQIARSPSFQ